VGAFTLLTYHTTVGWCSANVYQLQPQLAALLISMMGCILRLDKLCMFWKGKPDQWPLQVEEFKQRQAKHRKQIAEDVESLVLEMAVEIPMDEKVIGVTNREAPEGYSTLVPGLGRLQRYCDVMAADALHDLVIASCLQYLVFLKTFLPFPLRGSPLGEGQRNFDLPPWKDNGQRFHQNLLHVKLWMEMRPETETREGGGGGLCQSPTEPTNVTAPDPSPTDREEGEDKKEEATERLVYQPHILFVPSFDYVRQTLKSGFTKILDTAGEVENIFLKLSGTRGCRFKKDGWRDDLAVQRVDAELEHLLDDCMQRLSTLSSAYEARLPGIFQNEAALLETLMEDGVALEVYAGYIDALRREAEAVLATSANDIYTGLVELTCRDLRVALCKQAHDLMAKILDQLQAKVTRINGAIFEQYNEMERRMMNISEDVSSVLDLEHFIEASYQEREKLERDIATNNTRMDFLYKYRYEVDEAAMEVAMSARKWPTQMRDLVEVATIKAIKERSTHETFLRRRTQTLVALLVEITEQVEAFKLVECGTTKDGDFTDDDLQRNADGVEAIEAKLAHAASEASIVHRDERLLQWKKSEFPQIEALNREFEPYATLWSVAYQYVSNNEKWMKIEFHTLEAEKIDALVLDWYRRSYKLTKFFVNRPALQKVAEWTKVKSEALRKVVPLIKSLTNYGLRVRHWNRMSEVTGFKFNPAKDSMEHILAQGGADFMLELEDISDCASREYTLEAALDKMMGDWQGLGFELVAWRETGTHILKGSSAEEAQMLLEEHIIKTQAMKSSPFSKPIIENIILWERKLSLMDAIITEWLICQLKWVYLEPVFGAEEILKQMPVEGRQFAVCDKFWRGLMTKVRTRPDIMMLTEVENLKDHLRENNDALAAIEKKLNEYLDTKKMACPRFWFLSNDELLEILRETKDPPNVQPFVKKLIEAVRELEFQPDLKITSMISMEGERVPFDKPVDPTGESNGVELWMVKVEDAMRTSLHTVTLKALGDYPSRPRSEWIRLWPGQVVISVSQIFWTQEVNASMRNGGTAGLMKCSKLCTEELMRTVTLVRGELTKLERATIGALVVVDVHARDVVQNMSQDHVKEETDFKWQSQLRYYWEEDTVIVRMINAQAWYGYEYLGNSSRLVITPLTDRCYRTLLGAVHMNLGGAPAGPAGTGKTETTKDLSKAIAIQCIVFNCSDGLDYIAMGKFFKGLASCGAWACFDEFNRIELEVLSVVAQQILTIQRGLAAGKKMFLFEGVEIALRSTCNVFITMNPGYAGRSELPDNLKALFRDVAMMVPDYALISEIILYSFGYLEARSAGQKLVMLYKLCSEQLSRQDHYDYGMRAVMAVLRAAGNLKQNPECKDLEEDVLMLRAITDVNLPKFLDEDVPLFKGILSDLYPGVSVPEADYTNMVDALRECTLARGLQPLDDFFLKAIQLYEMIVVRHGLMLVGQSFSMKTSALWVLKDALTLLCTKGLNDEFKVKTYTMNPKSITMGQLYGQDDPISQEWTDGVLAKLFRVATRDVSSDRKWVVFDGPVDAIWIESMNTVLDDNKKLCLNSGEIVAMQGLMNMIFEVADLAVASPATVSRCGMVYMQPSQLGWRPPMLSWLDTLPPTLTPDRRIVLSSMLDWLVPPTIRISTRGCKTALPMQDINLTMSCMRLISSLLEPEFTDPEWLESNKKLVGGKGMDMRLECLVMFSLVWSFGVNTDNAGRDYFSSQFYKVTVGEPEETYAPFVTADPIQPQLPFPKDGNVYDVVFDKTKGKWVDWMSTVQKQVIPHDVEFTQITVATADTVRYTYLIKTLVSTGKHMLLMGPTGTGKSLYMKDYLMQGMDKNVWQYLNFTFSAQTSANMTQDIIDGKLDKRKKGVYGPRPGKRCVIFVDELNMPAVEVYGAQPPIELLRQYMDHGGWYDRKELTFRTMEDIQFVAAMGPPGGGRAHVTNRYLRHYSLLAYTEMRDDTLTHIFNVLISWWFTRCAYGSEISKYQSALVTASLDIYNTAIGGLLPTPNKMHYIFNLRDLSKVFQGIQSAATTVIRNVPGMCTRCSLNTSEIRRLVMLTPVLGAHVGKLYATSTLVLSLSASCSWDGGSRASTATQPECAFNVP
jgi:dynein heavy chain